MRAAEAIAAAVTDDAALAGQFGQALADRGGAHATEFADALG